jgi:hypothetical protein
VKRGIDNVTYLGQRQENTIKNYGNTSASQTYSFKTETFVLEAKTLVRAVGCSYGSSSRITTEPLFCLTKVLFASPEKCILQISNFTFASTIYYHFTRTRQYRA